ncbi:uncharacterized protein N7483_012418 [Penicillium malachiteum]|uniref:uncharacterized protein n=1 Tax=Penicillium malachiteum TaxID=1324776 RepID=UPI002546AA7E|nr:uncharacterized protein N7483_012418 [Penicillium malachiteum]KAJ5715237.1 hypothetical protein N7483_012418 [Penicillium malachiteum]
MGNFHATRPLSYAEADIMGQFPVLNAYTMLLYGFQLPLDVDNHSIVSMLQKTFDDLVARIPLFGCQVGTKESGLRTVLPWPENMRKERVHVNICDDSIASMEELLVAKNPARMLDGKELCPWPALPMPHGLTGPAPVVALQANFICGGLILTLAAHHTIMDGTADFQFLKMFFDLLSGRELESVDLEQANRDRSQLIPLIPEGEPVKDYPHLLSSSKPAFVMPASQPIWCYFLMPVESLNKLVKRARDNQLGKDVQISSDDILSAFYWKRLCALRIARGMPPDTESKCSRAINTRIALGIPSSYIGAQISPCITRLSLAQVIELNITQLAQILRTDLMEAATPWAVRSFATFISRKSPEARAKLLYTGSHDSNTDIGFTNMSKLERPRGVLGTVGAMSLLSPPEYGADSRLIPDSGTRGWCLPYHDMLA